MTARQQYSLGVLFATAFLATVNALAPDQVPFALLGMGLGVAINFAAEHAGGRADDA